MKCDDCGKVKADVRKRFCPFAEDVWDEKIEVTICDECTEERTLDI